MSKINKVAFAHIQAIVSVLVFKFERVAETTVTGCWAFLPNGFQVGYGESACVDPEEFNFETGKKWAKERCIADATNELWKHEGYMLKMTGNVIEEAQYMGTTSLEVSREDINGFTVYVGKPINRLGYEVKDGQAVTFIDQTTKSIEVAGETIPFKHHEPVKPGGFIVYLNDSDIYHCDRKVFAERNHI